LRVRRRLPGALFSALPVLFLCLFLLYPLARILDMALRPLLTGGAAAVRAAADAAGLGGLLVSSAVQALLSTALALVCGLPVAALFGRWDFPGKSVLRTLLTIPFVLPTVVVSSAFVVLIGSGGWLEKLAALLTGNPAVEASLMRSLPAVLAAHVFYNVAIVVRIVGGAWASHDTRLAEAARTLGSGKLSTFMRVTLRLLLPSISASALLVFAFCFSSFGVILVLGGPRMGTLETEIYRQAVYMFNLPAAAILSIIQLAATALVMYVYSRIQSRLSVIQNLKPGGAPGKRPHSPGEWLQVFLFGIVPTAALALPMGALLAGSFLTRVGPSFAYWRALFGNAGHSLFWSSPLLAAGHSLLFAFQTMLLSLALGIPAAYLIAQGQAARGRVRRLGASAIDLLFLLPLGTSAVTLGFGFIVSLNAAPFDLRGSALLIPIAHALVALPLVIRSLLAPLRSINPRLRESASLLGAGPVRVRLEIDLPLLSRAFVAAAAFAFTVSLGEFGATAILTRPELITLPVLIYNSLSRPGEVNQGQALALSVLLMAACGAGLAAIEAFRVRGARSAGDGGAEVF
jgi:thiamine transport system permease protein